METWNDFSDLHINFPDNYHHSDLLVSLTETNALQYNQSNAMHNHNSVTKYALLNEHDKKTKKE